MKLKDQILPAAVGAIVGLVGSAFIFYGAYRALERDFEIMKDERIPALQTAIKEDQSRMRKALLFVQRMHPEGELSSLVGSDSDLSTLDATVFQEILQGMKTSGSEWRVSEFRLNDVVYLGANEVDFKALSEKQRKDLLNVLYQLEDQEENQK